jgi:hypothetical protein
MEALPIQISHGSAFNINQPKGDLLMEANINQPKGDLLMEAISISLILENTLHTVRSGREPDLT